MTASGWRRKYAVFLPSGLIVLLVLLEGTQRFSIQNTAQYVAPFWFRHFPTLPYQRFWEFVEVLRKLGHLIGYGLVCLTFFGACYWWIRRRSLLEGWALKNRAAGWALVFTMIMGAADELHQRFVPQRTSTVTDVGFDVCGGYFALMVVFAVLRLRERSGARLSAHR
ncbi:MAG: VanZ family protein [Acidobacteriaceae bacterium]